jgi:uncharacterized protein YdiU (UPF0061 family)
MWRKHLSHDTENDKERLKAMRAYNPILIPRNHRIAEAINAGEQGDFKIFHRLVDALAKPYEEQQEYADLEKAPAPVEIVNQTFCGT